MGEGEGGGEQLNSYPPHLNPLPPGERRYFLRNSDDQIPKYLSVIEIWCLFDYWYLGFGYFPSASYFNAL